ncbi:HAD hydrolase-like protein [Paeniglutamicibacter terrestris]|uniref:HAD hydrolase-like protein n=1 Tax=Paeniglutamicibacter terrestris TaxID=2723403 RepID=A0ABX1G3W9_9MICC|nr:HAD hydrolase-like protein [Paeniglutamicibacter terrestris]NKG20664.1 HAD hydrolase-like protein [Paeniglutamicibacter terrestris]
MIAPSAVLLDLDGTLVDPAGAITSGIRHALTQAQIPDPGEEKLLSLIGPPLTIGLASIQGVTPTNIGSLISTYRAQYASHGMASSRPYPGVLELLGSLREAGITVLVATAKPTHIAAELLEIQGITPLLDGIFGNDDEGDGHSSSKTHIVAAALSAHDLDPAHCVMVGDRRYDIEAANENSMTSIGAEWGFAEAGELAAAGASAHAVDVPALAGLLLGSLAEESLRAALASVSSSGANA